MAQKSHGFGLKIVTHGTSDSENELTWISRHGRCCLWTPSNHKAVSLQRQVCHTQGDRPS